MFLLGTIYAKGNGVARNGDRARFWLETAKQAGHADAARALAKLDEMMAPEKTGKPAAGEKNAGLSQAPVETPAGPAYSPSDIR